MAKIILVGSAYPYRGGGITTFNERLIKEFRKEGHDAEIITFTLQYPSFLFPGKTQYSEELPPENLPIKRMANSCNPFNWIKVGRYLKKQKPDILLFRYWTPFMSPCFGTIARIVKKNKQTKIVSIIDNMIPHEKRIVDTLLSRYFVKPIDGFVAMTKSVLSDIRKFKDTPNQAFCLHPLYDNFGEKLKREDALTNLSLDKNFRYLLFFGLIRDYKGLDILLEAFADERLRKYPVKLIVAGEFYANQDLYYDLIRKLNLEDNLIMRANFIADNDVKNYFCASDMIVQPYKSATQSGVTQVAYHFEKPMLVTNVGGLPEMVPHMKAGYVVNPDSKDIADALVDFYEQNTDFSSGIIEEKKKYLWGNMTKAITELYQNC